MADWILKKTSANFPEIASALGITEILARLIVNRGIRTYEDARRFLNPSLETLDNPYLISGMDEAVCTVRRHISVNSKIAIYGDYDVDGVMSSVILYKSLNYDNIVYYVPDRETEGYGLNIPAIDKLAGMGVNLIIACDNGIASLKESRRIYEMGMELVIIDHHEPPYDDKGNDVLPVSEAIINPKISSCGYPFKLMCAAGLCYRFATALGAKDDDLLIFAATATICDIVDLTGDNRIIVKNGLSKIHSSCNLGINALIELYELKNINTYHIGFIIGPSINACGRLKSARLAFELFTTADSDKVRHIAKKMYELNYKRKAMTEEAYNEMVSMLPHNDKVFVLYSENAHESIAGIVAGRIKEKFNHPTIVITNGVDSAKGSARSIGGYNIFKALTDSSHLLTKYGGHSAAAGFSIPYENIGLLRASLNDSCEVTDFNRRLTIECRLPIKDITFRLAEELLILEPFGKENKEPVFAEKKVMFKRISLLGKDKRIIKLWVYGCNYITAIAFDLYDKFLKIAKQRLGLTENGSLISLTCFELDIAFTLSINEYKGDKSLQLVLKDIQ